MKWLEGGRFIGVTFTRRGNKPYVLSYIYPGRSKYSRLHKQVLNILQMTKSLKNISFIQTKKFVVVTEELLVHV